MRSYMLITLYPFLACLVSLIARQGLRRVRGETIFVFFFLIIVSGVQTGEILGRMGYASFPWPC